MHQENKVIKLPVKQFSNNTETKPAEFPLYPVNEDIYHQSIQEEGIDPENISAENSPYSTIQENVVSITNIPSAMRSNDLDVPGAELDDQEEEIGSEDEENNYYSMGGDNHTDLEEDKGE